MKNVEYKTEASELREHFMPCGTISRITIFKDPATGHPLGYALFPCNMLSRYAYIEFAETEAVEKAMKLNDSLFKGRQIRVERKRKNIPGLSRRRNRGFVPRAPMGGRMRGMFTPYPYGGRMMGYPYGFF